MTVQAFPYQGSKRLIAPTIIKHVPANTQLLYEPFCGSAALSLYALMYDHVHRVKLNDGYQPLIALLRAIKEDPLPTLNWYRRLWSAHADSTYVKVRDNFNASPHSQWNADPSYTAALLYLLCRCVKGAVRFNQKGEFNQSADRRRPGRHPDKMAETLEVIHMLLKHRADLSALDYAEFLNTSIFSDRSVVYLDPPYAGVGGKDKRYFQQLDGDKLIVSLEQLNQRNVAFLLSFDGTSRSTLARRLKRHLSLQEIQINAGRSAQATLLGRKVITKESLYISPILRDRLSKKADFRLEEQNE